jgi:hypothetical protein
VVHHTPGFGEIVDYGEAVELVEDVLGIPAVRYQIELPPLRSGGVGVEVESGCLPDDIEPMASQKSRAFPRSGALNPRALKALSS